MTPAELVAALALMERNFLRMAEAFKPSEQQYRVRLENAEVVRQAREYILRRESANG